MPDVVRSALAGPRGLIQREAQKQPSSLLASLGSSCWPSGVVEMEKSLATEVVTIPAPHQEAHQHMHEFSDPPADD